MRVSPNSAFPGSGSNRNSRIPCAARAALATLALLFSATVLCAADDRPTVTAAGESLHGAWVGAAERIAAFRGIPFAAPPLGDDRWRAPRPAIPRPGPQDATRFAPACMQGSGGVDWYVGVAGAFGHGPEVVGRPAGVSEDCLYLNVWTPRPKTGAGLPVMVFVHGGGNDGGWSYEPNYIGTALAARGVVVVTIAYRLGPFGFFAHPALNNGPGEPIANFGLLDIRAAFQWVRAHISAFGGAPGRLTAFGESAGAFNLLDLLAAELPLVHSDPLFGRLISQSVGGSLVDRQTLAQEQALWKRALADVLGPAPDAGALRRLEAGQLLEAAGRLPEDYYPDAVIDGRLLRRSPLDSIRESGAHGVEIILGTNADEWLMDLPETVGAEELERWTEANGGARAGQLLQAVAQLQPRRALDRLTTARQMTCPSYLLAEWANRSGGRGWIYRFSRQREGAGGERLGAYHGTELPYVFDTHDSWLPTTKIDRALTAAVMDYWTSFADRGRPHAAGRPEWPVYDPDAATVLELGSAISAVRSPDLALCGLLGLDAAAALDQAR